MLAPRLLLFLISASLAAGGDWPRFRGPNASGLAEGPLPANLDPQTAAWRRPLPPGSSSPVIVGDRLYLTGSEADELLTLALDRSSGEVLWRRGIHRERAETLHQLNNPASATPAADSSGVYTFFGDFGLIAYSPEGDELWRRPLGPFSNLHGMASSPVLVGDKLIVLCDQDVDAYLLAVDKSSGETLWRTERPEAVHGFATPTVFRPRGERPQIIIPGSYRLASYDAETGERLWSVRGITWQVKTTAVVDEDTVYVAAWAPGADAGARRFFPPFEEVLAKADSDGDGKMTADEVPEEMRHTGSWKAIDLDADGYLGARDWGFYRARWSSSNTATAVRPGGARGDLTDSHVVWTYERSIPVVPSPLLYEGLLYLIKDGGVLTALDAATGDVARQGRVREAIDKYYASPIAGDGKVYLFSESGKAVTLSAGREWETLAVADFGEPIYATPAAIDGVMYLRTASALYAFPGPR